MRAVSLATGYGGLDKAVLEFFPGTELVCVADNDADASKLLAHNYPDVPNLGDITAVDWLEIAERYGVIDIVLAGFPCQDLSAAGKRAGLQPGNRSGLWLHVAYGISQLRPRFVIVENVEGILSARAHSHLEPCPFCVGDDPGGTLRALGAVLGDLSELGFDAEWVTVPASAAGACHLRKRVFILAWRRDAAQDADQSAGSERRLAVTSQAA